MEMNRLNLFAYMFTKIHDMAQPTQALIIMRCTHLQALFSFESSPPHSIINPHSRLSESHVLLDLGNGQSWVQSLGACS